MRWAVIDLGTNTCNLLVAEICGGSFTVLHQSKQLVKLGDDKIKQNEISPAATLRTISAFKTHQQIIQKFQPDKIRVIATSAVRSAENKIQFLDAIGNQTGLLVKIVSGEKEAELIFNGVLLAFKKISSPAVILDIGGGSNELIITKNSQLLWKKSRPTGMARIVNSFPISDPFLPTEIQTLQKHFSQQHNNAIENCRQNKVRTLIGCSGAFDTIADIIDKVNPGEKQRRTQEIPIKSFYRVYQQLINSTREQRIQIKGMDMVRVDLIVPAVILIEILISEIGIQKIVQTDFALREGVLYNELQKSTIPN